MSEAWTLFGVEPENDELRTADISTDGLYRWTLTRRWGDTSTLTFIMLNPSTADAFEDDPTIGRCKRFARDLNFGGLRVVNLYAFRTSKPTVLWQAEAGGIDITGKQNDKVLRDALARTRFPFAREQVIAAWGAGAKQPRVDWLMHQPGSDRLLCLGVTKDGAPRHPLYLPASARPEPWRPR